MASPILAWTLISLCILPSFIIYVGFLSLGMKFIVVEGEYQVSTIYRRTKALMLDNKREVGACFFAFVVASAGSTIATYYLMGSQFQFLISYSLSLFLLSYTTALLKVTSFVFYFLIRDKSLVG